jgi:hypothetical protein
MALGLVFQVIMAAFGTSYFCGYSVPKILAPALDFVNAIL